MHCSRKASEVFTEILGGRPQKWTSIVREIVEVVEALAKWDIPELCLEVEQVLYALQMQAYQATGIDFRLRACARAVDGFYTRRAVWFEIFKRYDVSFRNEYLENGSNYKRAYKIKKALALAGVVIDTKEAVLLSVEYSQR